MNKQVKRKKRVKLTSGETIAHYAIVFFLLFISGLFAKDLFVIYITKNYSGIRTTSELLTLLVPILFLAIVLGYLQYRRLDFKEVYLNYTEEQFQEAIRRTVDDLEWRIAKNQKNFFRAYRPWNWTGSWGEMITIMKYKDRLLINSICTPDKMSSVISHGWNKKNISIFLTNLSETIQDIHKEPKQQEVALKNEWSLKMQLIRLFAYPFCLFLIGFGFYMISNPLTMKTLTSGIGVIIIATMYLYSDLKILTRKKINQKT